MFLKFQKIINFLFSVSKYFCMVLLCLISFFMITEVILRYFFNFPLMWAESAVKAFLQALSVLGAGMAIKQRAHMRVMLLWNKIPDKIQRKMLYSIDILIILFFITYIIVGYQGAVSTPGFLWEFGNLKKMWLVMILPVCGIIPLTMSVYVLIEDIILNKKGNNLILSI